MNLPIGNSIFGTAPIGLGVWLTLVPFSVGIVMAEEIRNAYSRRKVKTF